MARPRDNEHRSAILSALDQQFACSIKDVNNYLKEKGEFRSYQSTRRMLLKLVEDGLVSIHPQRRNKNEMYFIKGIASPHITLITFDNQIVPLNEFLESLYETQFPSVISKQVSKAIKLWMFDYLCAARPELFEGIREVPDRKQLRDKLKETNKMLEEMHSFIGKFLKAGIHSPVAERNLNRELETNCSSKQLEMLVTKDWLKETK